MSKGDRPLPTKIVCQEEEVHSEKRSFDDWAAIKSYLQRDDVGNINGQRRDLGGNVREAGYPLWPVPRTSAGRALKGLNTRGSCFEWSDSGVVACSVPQQQR